MQSRRRQRHRRELLRRQRRECGQRAVVTAVQGIGAVVRHRLVGMVDVAFTRKQDKTSEIQKLSAEKDRELRVLDEEFKDIVKDVD